MTFAHVIIPCAVLASAPVTINEFLDCVIVEFPVADYRKGKPFDIARGRDASAFTLEDYCIIKFHLVVLVGCLAARPPWPELAHGGCRNRSLFSGFFYGFHKSAKVAIDVFAVCGILNVFPSLAFLDFPLLKQECVHLLEIGERRSNFGSPPIRIP